jgi:glycosyltransferase involved in cell wall biosynthesis
VDFRTDRRREGPVSGVPATESPLVSILIPVYNREQLLIPCVESARAQDSRDIEIVIVDNASTDGTWDVCQRLAAEDPRIRIFRNPSNVGPVRNWARCLAEARGRYAKLLFSDDTIAPDFLTRTTPWLEDPRVGFAYTAVRIGRSESEASTTYLWPQGSGLHSSHDFILASLAGDLSVPVSPGCALFRLADLREAIKYELPLSPPHDLSGHGAGADMLIYLLTARRYPYFAVVTEPAVFFRIHENSITIRGLDGEVALSYVLARVWFARTYSYRNLIANQRSSLARLWLREMLRKRRLSSPTSACRRFGGVIGPGRLAGEAALAIPSLAIAKMIRSIPFSRGLLGHRPT